MCVKAHQLQILGRYYPFTGIERLSRFIIEAEAVPVGLIDLHVDPHTYLDNPSHFFRQRLKVVYLLIRIHVYPGAKLNRPPHLCLSLVWSVEDYLVPGNIEVYSDIILKSRDNLCPGSFLMKEGTYSGEKVGLVGVGDD